MFHTYDRHELANFSPRSRRMQRHKVNFISTERSNTPALIRKPHVTPDLIYQPTTNLHAHYPTDSPLAVSPAMES